MLGLWITIAAVILGWWWSRTANRLLAETSTKTQGLIEVTNAKTQELSDRTTGQTRDLIERTTANTQGILERMDQRADERHRESLQAIQALRAG
jgi:hypothetical protein